MRWLDAGGLDGVPIVVKLTIQGRGLVNVGVGN